MGIGSIAKRHIRNLIWICNQSDILLQIDAFRHETGKHVEGISDYYYDITQVPDDYDIVFITNPTQFHLDALEVFKNKGKSFFIEKPIVSVTQIDDFFKLSERILQKDKKYYVACPLRYNAVIQYIKQNINLDNVISVRSISSSYLPEWRSNIDYRDTYSAQKKLGGGVSVDLIHEWDYISYLFGKPCEVKCFIGKKSDLEIDTDDYAIYIAEYEKKIVELHLDYFGRGTIRKIELYTNEDTIIGDIFNNNITFLKSGKRICFNEERDDFQKRELIHFMKKIGIVPNDFVQGLDPIESEDSISNLFHAIDVLKLTQGIC